MHMWVLMYALMLKTLGLFNEWDFFPGQLRRSFCLQLISYYISIIIDFCLKYLLNETSELWLWWSWTFFFFSKVWACDCVMFRGQDSHLFCSTLQPQHCYGTWDSEPNIYKSCFWVVLERKDFFFFHCGSFLPFYQNSCVRLCSIVDMFSLPERA